MSAAILFKANPETLTGYGTDWPEPCYFNMTGDYSYLTDGYYSSLEAELQGIAVFPTTADALDAYVVPIAMEKARQHQLAVPGYDIVVDKLAPPVLAYPINPFSTKYEIVLDGEMVTAKLRTLTMTGKYAAICQKLLRDYRIDAVRCVLGRTLVKEYGGFAKRVFEVFKLPLMRVRVIVTTSDYLFSAIEPLPFDDLTLNEKKLLGSLGTWQR